MRIITDWHIHSKYSRACSQQLELPIIAKWCERKGIHIVASADWTHPKWFVHMQNQLVEDGQGIYRLKDAGNPSLSPLGNGGSPTRYILVTELSQIYKRGEKTRRVHNLVFSPSLETCEKVNDELKKRGFNLSSDGRPILGIDSEDLYDLLKEIDDRIILIPAHAWTPWYSVFGSKSGFDSLEECFGKMTPYIYAIETGLSSDPKMNWQLSALDRVVFISNSDAHSPRNLGREANVFEMEAPSYDEFVRILKEKVRTHFLSTIEFFPDEGKYHIDGCAKDLFSCKPKETKRLGGRCPKCKKLMTLGVLNRVEMLSDRESSSVGKEKIPFASIVPLEVIIADVFGVGTSSKRVAEEYMRLTDQVANEFTLLLETPIETIISRASHPLIAEGIRRVRDGKLEIVPGYDGLFGKVSIFSENERKNKVQKILV